MDESNVKAQEGLVRLRQKVLELQKVSPMNEEAFGTYQQTVLQIWKEAESRRQSCLAQVQDYQKQMEAAQAQAGAFSVMSSIMYSVVHGFVRAEEKRLQEEAERAEEKRLQEEDEKAAEEVLEQPVAEEAEVPEQLAEEKPKKRGRKKKGKTEEK